MYIVEDAMIPGDAKKKEKTPVLKSAPPAPVSHLTANRDLKARELGT